MLRRHLVLKRTFRLELLLVDQIYRGWHGHGRHAESSRQCFHRPCHHPQPGPSLTSPEPLAPRRRASKGLVIATLQGQGEKRGQTIGLFSAMLCQIKAAVWAVTSSSRRSVPKANRLLNSLSRTCRACKKQDTQALSGVRAEAFALKIWRQKRTSTDSNMSINALNIIPLMNRSLLFSRGNKAAGN